MSRCPASLSRISAYHSDRSPDWLKMKNPACAAVTREAEEDWASDSSQARDRRPYERTGLPASGRTRTSDFSHPPCADGSELYSKLLSVVLMKEMAMNGKKEP